MKKIQKQCSAFTLAEVLIVLVIIGVIASLTIPSLIQNTQKQEYVTALKKFYAEANQVLIQTAIDEGTPGKLGAADTDTLTADIISHFKTIKNCGTTTTDNCWAPTRNSSYEGTGNPATYNGDSNYYKFATPDGMNFALRSQYADCSHADNSDPNSPMYNNCGYIGVDVNGQKGPNRVGRDVFLFFITSNKSPLLYPAGGNDYAYWKSGDYCNPSHTWDYACTGRIMEEGWQMNY